MTEQMVSVTMQAQALAIHALEATLKLRDAEVAAYIVEIGRLKAKVEALEKERRELIWKLCDADRALMACIRKGEKA